MREEKSDMLVLKSGLLFLKKKNNVLISPYSHETKRISADCIDKVWSEMCYINKHYDFSDMKSKELLATNKLIFDVPADKTDLYYRYARNIQSFANLNNNPLDDFQSLISNRVLIVGLGTVGAALVKLMSKYGMNNISVLDGDKVVESNLTSQLLYDGEDVGNFKSEVVRMKVSGVTNAYSLFLSKANIVELFSKIKPELVFCCADDSTLALQNLLIDNIVTFKYKLFISGYSYDNIIIDCVTEKNIAAFKDLYTSDVQLSEENTIYHNTGTIAHGCLSASLIMQLLFSLNNTSDYNHVVLDRASLYIEKSMINIVSQEEKFDQFYEDYIKFLQNKDVSQISYKQGFEMSGHNYMCNYEPNADIIAFSRQMHQYIGEKGNFTEQYRNIADEDLDLVRKRIKNDVNRYFKDKYISLVNERKHTLTSNISCYLLNNYNIDFIGGILRLLEKVRKQVYVSPEKMLDLSLNQIADTSVSFAKDLMDLLKASCSCTFSEFAIELLQNGRISVKERNNRPTPNVTVYNPNKNISNIFINYNGKKGDKISLSHELMHAFSFDRLSKRLNIHNFKQINSDFWEIIANVGEMLLLENANNLKDFLHLSQYNLMFCLLDYVISRNQGDITSIDEIIMLKNKIVEYFGVNVDSMYYIDYNFMLAPQLYENNLHNYRLVYQDIVAFNIYKIVKQNKQNIDDFYAEINQLNAFSINALQNHFKIDLTNSVSEYTKKITSNFLKCVNLNI